MNEIQEQITRFVCPIQKNIKGCMRKQIKLVEQFNFVEADDFFIHGINNMAI